VSKKEYKKDYIEIQDKLIIELFKNMLKNVTPLEFKFFEKKMLFNLKDVSNIYNLEMFLDGLLKSQIE